MNNCAINYSNTRLPNHPIYCAACVSVKDWFAIVMDAVRSAPVAFTAAVNMTCPSPVPDAQLAEVHVAIRPKAPAA